MSRTQTAMAAARFALRDIRRFSFAFMACVTLLSCYHMIRIKFGDPRDYFAHQHAEGPLAISMTAEGKLVAGGPITTTRPGEVFGWISPVCLGEGVSDMAYVSFVRLAQAGAPEAEISRRKAPYGPQDRRCGPALGTYTVPADTLPGAYELRRWLVLREGTWWPLRGDLDPIGIQVVPLLTSETGPFQN